MNERSIDCPPELHQDFYLGNRKVSKPHTSLDAEPRPRRDRNIHKSTESINRYSPPLITPQLVTGDYQMSRRLQNNNEYERKAIAEDYHDYQNLQKVAMDQHQHHQLEDTVDKIAKGYDLVKASKIYNDSYDLNAG